MISSSTQAIYWQNGHLPTQSRVFHKDLPFQTPSSEAWHGAAVHHVQLPENLKFESLPLGPRINIMPYKDSNSSNIRCLGGMEDFSFHSSFWIKETSIFYQGNINYDS